MPPRLTNSDIQREAVQGALAEGTREAPIVVACHLLHMPKYVALVKRRLDGKKSVSMRAVMRQDGHNGPPEVIKELTDTPVATICSFIDAMAAARAGVVQSPEHAEAAKWAQAEGSAADPIRVACYFLHQSGYADMIRSRLASLQTAHVKFVGKERPSGPVTEVKTYEGAPRSEIISLVFAR